MLKVINGLGALVAAILVFALYVAKTEASSSEARLAQLQRELAEERGEINTLSANIAHLEDPEYLRMLAREHLGFEPVRADQEIALSDLPRIAPGEQSALTRRASADARDATPRRWQ
ncbi:cell division protein FtsL [Woodsholea maritima]|uniref:cell division protein FtsL n=1 Tax=Woodsholea maritima TaxID=240237 RepID=UPI0003A2A6A6|nr:hypothetical protein [Woodsholea maritima]